MQDLISWLALVYRAWWVLKLWAGRVQCLWRLLDHVAVVAKQDNVLDAQ